MPQRFHWIVSARARRRMLWMNDLDVGGHQNQLAMASNQTKYQRVCVADLEGRRVQARLRRTSITGRSGAPAKL